MMGPTIVSLWRQLRGELNAVVPSAPADLPVSAVHISELADPTPYLQGGELLMTNGLMLPTGGEECQAYVKRLVARRIAGLVIGLGPVLETVPPKLISCCEQEGLSLLSVGSTTPFLKVSRAYWTSLDAVTKRKASMTVGAHRGLIRAASRPDPTREIVRSLASSISGWAARLDRAGRPVAFWPESSLSKAWAVQAEAAKLNLTSSRASATFALSGENIIVLPLGMGQQRPLGFLVGATTHPLTKTDHHVVQDACALLTMDAMREQELAALSLERLQAVWHLLDLGSVQLARAIALRMGKRLPDGDVRLLLIDQCAADEAITLLQNVLPAQDVICFGSREQAWALIPVETTPDPTTLESRIQAVIVASARVILGPPVELAQAPMQLARLARAVRDIPPGTVGQQRPTNGQVTIHVDPGQASDLVRPLLNAGGPTLIDAVSAYLRNRGHWESASRALNVHRNTLRYRIRRAERLLGFGLDDADRAAELWLALRALALV